MSVEAKKKIAILGGGVGSMATAFSLTSQPGWQDRFEITVYQMGWRIGGKGASGRNPDVHQRIEEHGLHIWLGFYENAFRAMRECYGELKRPKGAPLAAWDDAFKKHVDVGFMEHVGDRWIPWMFHFPTDDRVPGDPGGPPVPALWTYLKKLVEWIFGHLTSLPLAPSTANDIGSLHQESWLESTLSELGHDLHAIVDELAVAGVEAGAAMAHLAKKVIDSLGDDPRQHSAAHHQALGRMLEELLRWLEKKVEGALETDDVLRRGYILIGLSVAIVSGMLDDGVLFHGLGVIERYEWIAWLKKHGASEYLVTSPPVRGLYDLVFAFEKGKLDAPNFAAGTALRSIFSILLDWKGAIFWKMQAGMGDTVFGPFYEVLDRRGVRFEYFHKVEELRLSEDRKNVASIRVGRQVDLAPGRTKYEPLVDVLGLPCWPSVPSWDQLDAKQVKEIREQKVDLESYYADWKPVETRTLERGRDFDVVVLAIPPGAHRIIASDLMTLPRWRDMVDRVATVQTQAQQLWLKPDLAALGWNGPSPVVDAFADPMNTWADMSQLIVRETWPEGAIGNVAYFCGP
ncbi:MAG: NAD(P)-binding protein, partial [Deltaproteobacteria bacterium]|nr:NAD(P)-binding protein [Deltaproteobacteria bacterium]